MFYATRVYLQRARRFESLKSRHCRLQWINLRRFRHFLTIESSPVLITSSMSTRLLLNTDRRCNIASFSLHHSDPGFIERFQSSADLLRLHCRSRPKRPYQPVFVMPVLVIVKRFRFLERIADFPIAMNRTFQSVSSILAGVQHVATVRFDDKGHLAKRLEYRHASS